MTWGKISRRANINTGSVFAGIAGIEGGRRDGLASKASDGALNRNVDRGHFRPAALAETSTAADAVTGIEDSRRTMMRASAAGMQPGKRKAMIRRPSAAGMLAPLFC